MKAARVQNGEVSVQEVDPPVPAADHALVRITAAGVCHSDLHLARGDWYGLRPEAVGHEAIGVVEDLGPGAERRLPLLPRVDAREQAGQSRSRAPRADRRTDLIDLGDAERHATRLR